MGKFRFMELDDDQDAFAGDDGQDASSEFAALLEEEESRDGGPLAHQRVVVSEKVSAPVIRVGSESVFVDLGTKRTGVAARDEWIDEPLPQEGDIVELFVKSVSGSEVVLTKVMKAQSGGEEEWLQAKESGAPIEAKVEKAVNGGFQVKAGSTRAFVPVSHMDTAFVEDPEVYVGQTHSFQVLEVKEGGRNIILSRRNLLRQEEAAHREKLLGELQVGETRTATITKLMPFGAFAKLGPGTEGLIPLGEMAWKRISKASDVVKEGESVEVKILSLEREPKLRIGLSLKDAGSDPWQLASTQLQVGQTVPATVARVTDFGAFAELENGIQGLVHVSELSWTKRVRHPGDVLRPGEKVSLTVLKVEAAERKLSLSLRGPMPEGLQQKASKLAQDGQQLNEEERALAQSWKDYQEQRRETPSQPQGAESSALAEAFKTARRARRK